jgi:hypothetical protein
MEIVLVVAAVLAGVVVAYLAQQAISGRAGSLRRAFARVPPSTVGAPHAPGVRRLSGTARPLEEPPVSEASGRPYLAQDLRIVASDGGDSGSMRGAQRAVDFLLDDGTGVALVRAEHGLVTIARDFEAPRTTLDKVPWVDALLRAGGYRNGSPATCKVRVYEGVLLPGGHAGVVGHVEPADAAARAVGATVVVRAGDATEVMVRAEAADR